MAGFFASPLGGAVLNLGTNLLTGLFGGSQQKKQNAFMLKMENEKFIRLRDAAEAGGFNPLTALQSGYQSPLAGGGVPPLASTALVQDSLKGFADVVTGKAAQDMARDKLDLELGKLALETGRANLATVTRPSAVRAMGGTALGRNTVKAPPGVSTPAPARVTTSPPPYKPEDLALEDALGAGRPVQEDPVLDLAGFVRVDNALTGPAVFPGEESPEGMDAIAMAPLALPQMGYNWAKWQATDDLPRMNQFRKVFGVGPRADRSETPPMIDIDLSGGKPAQNRYDLRGWPFNGFGFNNYRVN